MSKMLFAVLWHVTLVAIQGVSLVHDMPAVHRIVRSDEQAVKRIVMNLVRCVHTGESQLSSMSTRFVAILCVVARKRVPS
eukprot:6567-Heterococcus_DN1.PRE.12